LRAIASRLGKQRWYRWCKAGATANVGLGHFPGEALQRGKSAGVRWMRRSMPSTEIALIIRDIRAAPCGRCLQCGAAARNPAACGRSRRAGWAGPPCLTIDGSIRPIGIHALEPDAGPAVAGAHGDRSRSDR
jgi:hypothetical protein